MANSKCEYVKSFEAEDKVFFPNLIVVRIDGRDFRRFSKVLEFAKPNDETALNLMNLCASSVVEEFPDIVFSYGYSDEYSFALKKTTKFYQRRACESLIASRFTSSYVTKWKNFFPQKDLKYPPSFRSRVISCATIGVLQAYLSWRQNDCHVNNQQDSCLYELVKNGKSEEEAQQFLKGTGKKEKHGLLFEQFGINYEKMPVMFRQGSCILKSEVEDIVKHNEDGGSGERRSKNIGGKTFWNQNPDLLKELGSFTDGGGKIESDYIRSFQLEPKLLPSTWISQVNRCIYNKT